MSSPFPIEEVTTREELDAVVECIWDVMAADDSAHKVFFPVLSTRAIAVEESQKRLWDEHQSDPSSHWVFVRDPLSSPLRVLGACQWRLYKQNPFPNGAPQIEATWWPEGEGRRFASSFLMQCLTPRVRWMSRPHSGLSWCVVSREYQRQGIGRALMDWGLKQTDDLGIESYIEATPAGRLLYEQCGYRPVARVDVVIDRKEESHEWNRLVETILPSGYDSMWRPIGGRWSESQPPRTWD